LVKFLIIRFSSIGDIVLTTPVIRCLKKQIENVEIHFLTKKQYQPILNNNPHLTKIYPYHENLSELITELKNENYDYIIDLQNNVRSSFIKLKLKILSFTVKKLNIQKWLLVNCKLNYLPDQHIVDRYLQTITIFDAVNDNLGLDYFIPGSDEILTNELPQTFCNGFICFVIGAKHFTKRLPKEKIISLCSKINQPIILLGGNEEFSIGEEIAKKTGNFVFNGCGEFTINQSASLIKQARSVITHDTGMMHIAAAFHKQIFSIWGNTVPEFGMYPYLPAKGSAIIEVKGLKCRPCSKIGFTKCPKKHFKCMNEINETQLVDLVTRQ
jgi:ADP-heptose:LPS heptosyltransferase